MSIFQCFNSKEKNASVVMGITQGCISISTSNNLCVIFFKVG